MTKYVTVAELDWSVTQLYGSPILGESKFAINRKSDLLYGKPLLIWNKPFKFLCYHLHALKKETYFEVILTLVKHYCLKYKIFTGNRI